MLGNRPTSAPTSPRASSAPAPTFFSASVTLGFIGPARMFGAGAIVLSGSNYFWLIGFILPLSSVYSCSSVPQSIALLSSARRLRRLRHDPRHQYQLFCWLGLGLTFIVVVEAQYCGWWSRYTYVLSGAGGHRHRRVPDPLRASPSASRSPLSPPGGATTRLWRELRLTPARPCPRSWRWRIHRTSGR